VRIETDSSLASRVPILIWVVLVYGSTMFWQLHTAPEWHGPLAYTVVILLHLAMYWYGSKLSITQPAYYYIIQGMLVFACAFFMPNGYPAALIGLFPVLIAQSGGLFFHRKKVTVVTIYCSALFIIAVVIVGTPDELAVLAPTLVFMLVVVVTYAVLFYRQVHARIRTQSFLDELELAHRKVEELTLANERQRMARDLHDTLAQGFAGLIMRLEAVDAHLTSRNAERAQQIVRQSMEHARQSLADAREAIGDLRAKSAAAVDFERAVREEAARFVEATGIQAEAAIRLQGMLPRLLAEHGLYIVSECLANTAKHAHASRVTIKIEGDTERFAMDIRDDGRGFDANAIGRQSGRYGLIGIQERARLIGGTLTLRSDASGTTVRIEVPLVQGGSHED
jgi:two-component system, NarL family, sensor histidine kinase YdfH